MKLKELLLRSQRISGTRKPITIINPNYYHEFFTWLKESNIRIAFKAFIALCLSGGLRVSEALAVRRRDLNLESGFFRVRVLKKSMTVKRSKTINGVEKTYHLAANKVFRDAKLHPVAIEIINEYLRVSSIKVYDKLFPFKRNAVHKRIKRYFGALACAHMMRHSHISWLLHAEKVADLTVARMLEISRSVISSYNHVDTQAELNRVYGGKS